MSRAEEIREIQAMNCEPCKAWLKTKGHLCATHTDERSGETQALEALITTSLIEELEGLRGKADYDLPYPELSEAQNPIVSVIDQRIAELKKQ